MGAFKYSTGFFSGGGGLRPGSVDKVLQVKKHRRKPLDNSPHSRGNDVSSSFFKLIPYVHLRSPGRGRRRRARSRPSPSVYGRLSCSQTTWLPRPISPVSLPPTGKFLLPHLVANLATAGSVRTRILNYVEIGLCALFPRFQSSRVT